MVGHVVQRHRTWNRKTVARLVEWLLLLVLLLLLLTNLHIPTNLSLVGIIIWHKITAVLIKPLVIVVWRLKCLHLIWLCFIHLLLLLLLHNLLLGTHLILIHSFALIKTITSYLIRNILLHLTRGIRNRLIWKWAIMELIR